MSVSITVRVPEELDAELERVRAWLCGRAAGVKITKSDALRHLAERGLKMFEADLKSERRDTTT